MKTAVDWMPVKIFLGAKMVNFGPKAGPKRVQTGQTKENGWHMLQTGRFARAKEPFATQNCLKMTSNVTMRNESPVAQCNGNSTLTSTK